MSKALFAYDAWNSVTFAAEEMREPEKNLPKALVLGTLGIMAAYCAAVVAYLYMVPIQEMFAVKDNRIAAEAAQRMIFNDRLDAAVAAFFLISVVIILADSMRTWAAVLGSRKVPVSSEAPYVATALVG